MVTQANSCLRLPEYILSGREVYFKHSWKLELRKKNWWHILFLHYFSLLVQRSFHWGLCCSPWLTCSVSLWISPFQKWYQIISSYGCRKAKCTHEGPLQPHQNPCPLTFHHLTPQGQNHRQWQLHLGMATLCFPSLPPWFCHPFSSADNFRPFFLLQVLQIISLCLKSLCTHLIFLLCASALWVKVTIFYSVKRSVVWDYFW